MTTSNAEEPMAPLSKGDERPALMTLKHERRKPDPKIRGYALHVDRERYMIQQLWPRCHDPFHLYEHTFLREYSLCMDLYCVMPCIYMYIYIHMYIYIYIHAFTAAASATTEATLTSRKKTREWQLSPLHML